MKWYSTVSALKYERGSTLPWNLTIFELVELWTSEKAGVGMSIYEKADVGILTPRAPFHSIFPHIPTSLLRIYSRFLQKRRQILPKIFTFVHKSWNSQNCLRTNMPLVAVPSPSDSPIHIFRVAPGTEGSAPVSNLQPDCEVKLSLDQKSEKKVAG